MMMMMDQAELPDCCLADKIIIVRSAACEADYLVWGCGPQIYENVKAEGNNSQAPY